MRNIIKNIKVQTSETILDVRLRKMDALSGACLLRLVLSHLEGEGLEALPLGELPECLFHLLSEPELRTLMTSALNHAEVLLDAGYQPIMTGSEWGVPELEHDAAACLRISLEACVWTLRDFFLAGGFSSPPSPPVS